MKKWKKLTALLLSGVLMAGIMGCGVPKNTVHSPDDMASKKIGVQLGTTGDTLVTDAYKDDKETAIERYKKGADAVQSLKQGKIDCVVIDSEPANAFVEQNKDLKILDTEYTDEDYAIAIAKDNKDLKKKINAALAELKADGTLDQIMSNYSGDTKGTCPYESPEDVDTSNGKLVMATNAAFKPYEYYENNKIVGIDPEMAQAVADKLGMELEIVDMDFDAIINAVQSGKADIGVAGMTVNEERLQSIDFTDTYAKAKQVIIVRAK